MGTNYRTAVAAIAVVTALLTGSATLSTTPASAKRAKQAKKARPKSSVLCHNVGVTSGPGVPASAVTLTGEFEIAFLAGEVRNLFIPLTANVFGPGVPPAGFSLTDPALSVSGLNLTNPMVNDVFTITIAAGAIVPGIPATAVTLSAVVTTVIDLGGGDFRLGFSVLVPAGSLVPPAGPVCSNRAGI